MQTKPLVFGLIGFLLGGLLVSLGGTVIHKRGNDLVANMSISQMADSLKSKKDDAFDKAFISEMIGHHQGAIDMANLAKTNAKHDEIKKMADDIITAQTKEINQMQMWQSAWGYTSTPMSHDINTMNH